MIRNTNKITFWSVFFLWCGTLFSQTLTFSPYSRFGLGEMNSSAFAAANLSGGAFIGLKSDTAVPVYINAANPAAVSGIRLTTFELGGTAQFTEYNNGISKVKTHNINFNYGSLGFPLKQRASACFGLMPYSSIGYNLQNTSANSIVGNIQEQYSGNGGVNKAFLALAINPFKKSLQNFYRSTNRDSLIKLKQTKEYKKKKFTKELLTELSIGGRADYLFGNILHTSSIIYPTSTNYYHTRRYRALTISDFTGSFGLQTSFTIDSVSKREMRRKVKIGFGYFVSLPNTINVKSSTLGYNYSLGSFGDELPKDTFIYVSDKKGNIRLPIEQGIGISFKKGDLLAASMDAAYTGWKQFRYLDAVTEMKNSYRFAAGLCITPSKYSAGSGAYLKRVQYRIGGYYKTGFIELKNTDIADYGITAGFSFPVGLRMQPAVVNLGVQLGELGSLNNNLLRERYARVILGFTFNDKWFTKFRYD